MNLKIDRDAVLVITDSSLAGMTSAAENIDIDRAAIVLAVRDDATEEQRDLARQRAAEIVAARHGGTA